MDQHELLDRLAVAGKLHAVGGFIEPELTAKQDMAEHTGPYQAQATKLFTKLRKNLVDTVLESWEKTGFAWEQYNPESGEGQRTQHFTGWTSLVVKMMAMPDLLWGPEHDEL